MQGVVKVRVRPNLMDAAIKTWLRSPNRAAHRDRFAMRAGWPSSGAHRSEEVNQRLPAGIYASGLESGNDLEMLFLELTRDKATRRREGASSV